MLKALIVDDEDSTRDILKNYIPWSEIGIDSVSEADNGLLALDLAMTIRPGIILCDVRMPKMNGIEFAAQISQTLPKCKIFFLSAYSDKEYLKSAIMLKAVNYIEKPINLDEIIQVLKQTAAECAKEKDEQLQSMLLMQQTLCYSLTTNAADMNRVFQLIREMNIDFPEKSTYISCLIQIRPIGSESVETCTMHVLARLKIILEKYGNQYIYMMKGEGIILFHFNTGYGSSIANFKDGLRMLILEANIVTEYKIYIALGDEVNGLQSIYASYQTAVVTLYKQFFHGHNRLVNYTHDDSAPFVFDETILKNYSECLKSHEKNEAVLIVKRLVNNIRSHTNTPPDLVREIFYNLTLAMSKFAEKMNITMTGDIPQIKLNKLANAATLAELEDVTLEMLGLIFSHLDTCNTSQDLVSKATGFINENFMDPDLSVELIARKLFITPNYISSLFRNATGKTISQYITDIRIENAMELLKNTDRKLYDVAKSVGYNDGKYFSKVFEKVVGIKPRNFRGLEYD